MKVKSSFFPRAFHAGYKSAGAIFINRRGIASIEFAVIVAIFAVILAACSDFGLLIFSRFRLENAVSDAASYAMVNASMVDSANGTTLASNIAKLLAQTKTLGDVQAAITVNGGPSATFSGNTITTSSIAGSADACYCPTGTAGSLTWGSQQSCGSSCPTGELAGKYVLVTVKQKYLPMFSNYGIASGGYISASAVVRTQ